MKRCLLIIFVFLIACSDKKKTKTSKYLNETIPVKTTGLNVKAQGITIPLKSPAVSLVRQPVPDKSFIEFHPFENYNTEHGLGLSTISCEYVDKSGNLWIGTYGGGVCRYDGQSFTNFNTNCGLSDNTVYCIGEDTKGNFWFGTDAGVDYYNGKDFTNYNTKQGLANNTVNCITVDQTGRIWFGTDAGISYYDSLGIKSVHIAGAPASNHIKSIATDKNGNIWIGTNGNGLYRYNGKSLINYSTATGLKSNIIVSLMADNDNIWIGTKDGVSCFNGISFIKQPEELSNGTIKSIVKDEDGVWFSIWKKGVFYYTGNKVIKYSYTNSGLTDNKVTSIAKDKTGSLWFGTFGNGVFKYNGPDFSYYTLANNMLGLHIRTVFEDKKNNIWLAGDDGSLWRYKNKMLATFSNSSALQGYHIWCSTEDTNGNLWLGTYGKGLIRFDGKSFSTYTTAQGLPSDKILCITTDHLNRLWFGTYAGGICCINGDSLINYTASGGLAHNKVWCSLKDKQGNLWFGTIGGGISKFDGKSFTNYTTNDGLASNSILCIVEDSCGNLWFGTDGGGVSRYDGHSFLNFKGQEGLTDGEVYSIVIDKGLDIVLGTNQGLTFLRNFRMPENSNDIIPNKELTVISAVNKMPNEELQKKEYIPFFDNYSIKNNYQIRDINTNAMICDDENVIWAGCGDNKLIRFDCKTINKNINYLSDGVYIQSVKLNNKNVCWTDILLQKNNKNINTSKASNLEETLVYGRQLDADEKHLLYKTFRTVQFDSVAPFYSVPQHLILPYQFNQITFNFSTSLAFSHADVKYRYKLIGYDKDWSPVTDKETVSYGNIDDGKYKFAIMAVDKYGKWSGPLFYEFTVLPPWYRTWWAYSIYTLLILGSVRGYIFQREIYLKREKKLLEDKLNEQKKAKDILSQSEAKLKQTQEIAHIGSWELSLATNIATWSEEACRIYGIPVENNQHTFEEWQSFIHPEDLGSIKTELEKSRTSLGAPAFFHRIIRNDGAIRYVYSQFQFQLDDNNIPANLYCVSHDVTEIKEIGFALQQSEKNLRLIVDLIPQVLVVKDYYGNILFANKSFAALCNLTPEQIVNKPSGDAIPQHNELNKFTKQDREVIDTGITKIIKEQTFVDYLGNTLIMHVTKMPYTMVGKNEPVVLGIAEDITMMKKNELERSKIITDIIQRNRELEQFSNIVSHNLRQPVASIIGLSGLLQGEANDTQEKAIILDGLLASANNLDKVIHDLNYILQIKNQVTEQKENIVLSQLFSEVITSIFSTADEDNIEITSDFSQANELFTIKNYLYSIFYNLVSNSIKYHQPGKPAIIKVVSRKEDKKIVLEFYDNGLGIDLVKNGDDIFGFYKRFHHHKEGKGLGLFIVKTQVETLGGKISVASELNKGTTFTIIFDLVNQEIT